MQPDSPSQARRSGHLGTWTVFALALIARALTFFELRGDPLFTVPVGDAAAYDRWARELAAGDWGGSGVFFQAPLYPYALGLLYAALGPSLVAARVAQMLLGALSACLVMRLAQHAFGRRTAFTSGLVAALYAPFVYYEGLLLKPAVAVFLTLVLCLQITRMPWSARRSLFAGSTLAALTLVCEQAVALAPLLVALAWRSGRVARLPRLGLLATGVLLVLLPVGLRNLAVGGEFVLGSTNFGSNLYIGNGPQADGLYVPLTAGHGTIEYEADDARLLAETATGRPMDARATSRFFLGRALEWMAAEPAAALRLFLRKLRLVMHDREWMDSQSYVVFRERSGTLTSLGSVLRWGLVVPLAVLGIWWSRRARGRRALAASLALLAGSMAAFFVFGRFRVVLVPLAIPFAVFAAGTLVQRLRSRDWRAVLAAVAILGPCAWISFGEPAVREYPFFNTYNNLGTALLGAGRADEARASFERAIAAQPDLAMPYFNLGRLHLAQGAWPSAVSAFADAARRDPGLALAAHLTVAEARLGSGDTDEVRRLLRGIDVAAMNRAQDHFRYALLARRTGDLEQAESSYRRAIELQPTYAEAHNNLGYLLRLAGRICEGVPLFERALALDPGYEQARANLAWTLAASPDGACRDGQRALELARLVIEHSGRSAANVDLLAAAWAERGDFGRAEQLAAEAARLARDAGDAQYASRLEALRRLFADGRPFRLGPR
jgi:tetratricopeptide (TPR) repeat protein